MGLLSSIARSSSSFKELEKRVTRQKERIAILEQRLEKAQAALRKKPAPTCLPAPYILVARPGSDSLAERVMALIGQILAARIARRTVGVDWRENGVNLFYEAFQPSLLLPQYDLAELDDLYSQAYVPAPAGDPEKWGEFFRAYDPERPCQVLYMSGDSRWKENFPQAWLEEITYFHKLDLDQVEKFTLCAIWRPSSRLSELSDKLCEAVKPHECLGVYVSQPSGAPAEVARQALAEAERQGRVSLWLLTDSEEVRVAFDKELGSRVLHLRPEVLGSPLGELAGIDALARAPYQFTASQNSTARIIRMLSGCESK